MELYYFEKSNGGWFPITRKRYKETKNPAICTEDTGSSRVSTNIPGIFLRQKAGSGYSVVKEFSDGRMVEIPSTKIGWDEKKVFQAIDRLMACETLEAYENALLEEKISSLESRLREARTRLEKEQAESSELRSEIERMNKKAEDFFSELSTAIEINEKGGPGSRKKVREILEKLLRQINVEEEEFFDNEEQDYYTIENFSF